MNLNTLFFLTIKSRKYFFKNNINNLKIRYGELCLNCASIFIFSLPSRCSTVRWRLVNCHHSNFPRLLLWYMCFWRLSHRLLAAALIFQFIFRLIRGTQVQGFLGTYSSGSNQFWRIQQGNIRRKIWSWWFRDYIGSLTFARPLIAIFDWSF